MTDLISRLRRTGAAAALLLLAMAPRLAAQAPGPNPPKNAKSPPPQLPAKTDEGPILRLEPPVVPVATATPVARVKPSWQMTGEFSLTDVSGNKAITLLTTGFRARLLDHPGYELAFTAGIKYGRSQGDVAAESYDSSVDLRFSPGNPVSPYLNAKGNRDLIRGIELRVALAAGADFNLYRHDDSRISIGTAILQDYERHEVPAGETGTPSSSRTRFNVRAVLTTTLRPGVKAENRTLVEPAANDIADYLFTSETTLRVNVSRRLAVQTAYVYNRDSSPPPGVLFESDRTLMVGLLVELGKTPG